VPYEELEINSILLILVLLYMSMILIFGGMLRLPPEREV
jgi:hypothetical protein